MNNDITKFMESLSDEDKKYYYTFKHTAKYLSDKEKEEASSFLEGDDYYEIYSVPKFLVKKQGITDEELAKIIALQINRLAIEEVIYVATKTNDRELIDKKLNEWKSNEFKLQETWHFEQKENMHRWFLMRGCECPVLDNEDALGVDYNFINEGCPIHGRTKI